MDPATPLAMARATTRSASFDVELGESRMAFDREPEVAEALPAPPTPALPARYDGRRGDAAGALPPFAFFQPTPLSASPMVTTGSLASGRREAKGAVGGRYEFDSPSPSPSSSPEPLFLKPNAAAASPPSPLRAASSSSCETLDEPVEEEIDVDDGGPPPFSKLDATDEGSTTFADLPRDVQLRIMSLVPEEATDHASPAPGSKHSRTETRKKRDAALVCTMFRDLLLDGGAWPRVDLCPVTARSAAWLARRAGGGGGSGDVSGPEGKRRTSSLEEGRAASPPSALSLSSSSSGIREVTLRPSTEQQAVLFNDVFLATAPRVASLAIDAPWHASALTDFAFVFWALRFQRGLRRLRLKVKEVDLEALPTELESLEIECSRFSSSSGSSVASSSSSDEERGGGDERTREAANAAASAALPSLPSPSSSSKSSDHRGLAGLSRLTKLTRLDLAVWSYASTWQDLSPLLSLTRLRSLSLNTHPFESSGSNNNSSGEKERTNASVWERLGATAPDLRSLTISAAPGFDAPLPSLPPYCDLHFFTRGGFRASHLAASYAANLVSLELKDLSLQRFDARALAPCRRLASLDVSFAADAGVVDGLEAVSGSLRSLKTGCPALRLVLPPSLPCLEELEAVAFHDLDLSCDRGSCAALLGNGKLRSVYLAALDFGVGVNVFIHEAGKKGLDLRFATRPLRAVFTPDQLSSMVADEGCPGGGGGAVGGGGSALEVVG